MKEVIPLYEESNVQTPEVKLPVQSKELEAQPVPLKLDQLREQIRQNAEQLKLLKDSPKRLFQKSTIRISTKRKKEEDTSTSARGQEINPKFFGKPLQKVQGKDGHYLGPVIGNKILLGEVQLRSSSRIPPVSSSSKSGSLVSMSMQSKQVKK